MKTLLKIIGGLLAVFVVAAIGLTLYFRFFFDPNDLRNQITQRVQDKTGRELVIEGDLSISTFPWVSANIGRTTLSDDAAFGEAPLLSFDSASASVKLLPLLKKQIQLGTTSIDGAEVNLVRMSDGRSNWNALMDAVNGNAEAEQAPTPESASGFQTQSLGAIDVSNATIIFKDARPGGAFETLTVSGLDLKTGELAPGAPFDVQLASRLEATNVGVDVSLKATAEMTDTALSLESPRLTLAGSHYAVPFNQFDIELDTEALTLGESDVDMGNATVNWTVQGGREAAETVAGGSGVLSVSSLSVNGEDINVAQPELSFDVALKDGGAVSTAKGSVSSADIAVNGSELKAQRPVVEATVKGESIPGSAEEFALNLDDLALNLDNGALNISQYVADVFGLSAKGKLTGSNVLEAATLSGPVEVEPFNLRALLESVGVELTTTDANALTRMSGNASLRVTPNGFELRDLNATLDDSQITGLVKLVGDTPELSLSMDKLKLDGYLSPPDDTAGEDRAVDAIELPAQTVRDLNVNAQLSIGDLTVGGIESSDVEVQLNASNGSVRLHPMRANLYGGSYSGDMRVNAQGELPQVSLNESFNNVDFGAFTQAIAGTQRLTGRVTGALKMTAEGHNTRDLKATSNGTVSFAFADGVLDGVNVMETVRNIVAAANKEPLTPDEPNKTEFRSLKGTATISEGVLANNDLNIDIPLMRIGGKGKLDLNTKAIDYRVSANVVQEGDVPLEKELQFIADYTLPLIIRGTYEEPKVDTTASIADLAKQYAKRRVQDTLLDKLGLGNKDDEPAAEGEAPAADAPALTPEEKADQDKEKIKDAIDQKLKDKLKDLLGD